MSNESDINTETPLLSSIPKRNPFSVPDGYFDTLPSSLLEKCRQAKPKPEFSTKTFWLLKPQWMLAVFAVAAGLTVFIRSERNTANAFPPYQTLASALPDSALYSALQNNIEYVDVNSLEDALPGENLAHASLRSDSASVNRQEIVNYLINHNVNVSDIEDAL